MAQAGDDQNRIPTMLVVDTNGVTQPLRCDPSTSRLLLDITGVTTTSPATLAGKIDENNIHTSYVVDATSGEVTPLIADNRNGLLFIDLLVE